LIDVLSFSDIAQTRYIDNFVIDVFITKYLESTATNVQRERTWFFPTELWQWMAFDDKVYQKKRLALSKMVPSNQVTQVLIPVYMAKHWGLVYIDLENGWVYFDDGMLCSPPNTTLPYTKKAHNLLQEMFPSITSLQNPFWHGRSSFKRFGMPSQAAVDSRMIGVGSCGIGVIKAYVDFIVGGPATVNNVRWQYLDMHLYRKQLMLHIHTSVE